ncbi:1,3-beta-galactosyl-N-acetylhexosamine phosphorylase [Alloscardovia macacae]|uniref:Lacto N-biose phorylase n=1 Tax=Alloscardovia macacae TaxID=1160091 RepID=A0A261F4W9_9BIFI|nr:1,3-beta-galactosyl-N-acetylhexosamine phosphorylase [Alloscardovia macacae]OZG54187.1 lacto N-biose phorylase [Alloscardovia macacae]
MTTTGRFTIPSEENYAKETGELAELWGADAVRNSDGTHLDADVLALGKKIYSAYFPTRAHNEWISLHMDETPQVYLLTNRILAESTSVDIALMESFYEEQLSVNYDVDPHRYWEVIDRTTGEVVAPELWSVNVEDGTVHVDEVTPMHEYTVSFLAYIIWDPVEMYNHLTNDWGDKEHEIPFDIYHEKTREFVFETFHQWLKDNPQTDVVRFTTFFYQFTLLFDNKHREKVVDWFGSACTVSPKALDDFEAQYGYRLRPEDFIDMGSYNSAWRIPRKPQRDWNDFLTTFVRANVKRLVQDTHAHGKEAMMFLGDQWIGTEPYKKGFEELELDAVVGSVGDGTTLRMIADIPGVRYTEGRFLPYFFPDTFYEGNDPSIEGLDNWRKARRAILRSPISRMGYGGYLSLANKFPKFVDTVTHIADEFRTLHEYTNGAAAEPALTVALVNCWGAQRSWMAFTVAHALPNKQTHSYYGILEALSGMRVNVRFISFEDILEHGIDEDIDVLINGGPVDTAFSGGDVWENPRLVEIIRAWVRAGGAFVGVGEPSSVNRQGRFFQLADVLGVDEERFHTLSVDKYFPQTTPRSEHFITRDVPEDYEIDFGEPILNTYPIHEGVTVLSARGGEVQLVANEYGAGRGVYISGLPYCALNARLLERVLFYASHNEEKYDAWSSTNPECEVAHYPEAKLFCVINNTDRAQATDVRRADGTVESFELEPSAMVWRHE